MWTASHHWMLCLDVLLLALLLQWDQLSAIEIAHCESALGMENGAIGDADISASSAYDAGSVGPRHARLRQEKNGGAWCPKNQITKDVREWLEIDLRRVHVTTGTRTQGRFGNGQGQEYAEQYMLEYWRPGLQKWTRWSDRTRKEQLLAGNTNTYTVVENLLEPPILASKIRLVPYSVHPRTVCMRVELLGCVWTEGLVTYSMPQGVQRGSEVDLADVTYDGRTDGGHLQGGLGQLVDGQKGQDNFRLDRGHGKGYEWVGWKNESGQVTRPVEITFEFDRVRNFSAMYLHTNNLFSKDVQVFSHAKVYFSIGGRYYNGEPVHFSYMPDLIMEHARNVTIKLHNRIGRFIKLQMFFASKWIMISEVSFDSVPAGGNFSEEEGEATQEAEYPLQRDGTQMSGPRDERNNLVATAEEGGGSGRYIGLVIGVLAAVILLLVAAILFIVVRHRRLKPGSTSPHSGLSTPFADKRVAINMKVAVEDQEVDKSASYQEPFPVPLYNAAYATIGRQMAGLNGTSPEYSECTTQEYAVPLTAESIPSLYPSIGAPSPMRKSLHRTPPSFFPKPPSSGPPTEKYYAATDICNVPATTPPSQPPPPPGVLQPINIQGACGNSTLGAPNMELLREDVEVYEFPKEQLKVLERIGEGQFGEILLCEPEGLSDLLDVAAFEQLQRVVVKSLRSGISEAAKQDFHLEVKALARLKDPNLAAVVAVSWAEPRCVLTEYFEDGDLNQFLQQHLAESASNRPPAAKTLSYGCLIYMATQIASAMKYLESLNFVHRDLATRNCLVGPNYTVKITDTAMSRSIYIADYYNFDGQILLPVRWMSWESLLLAKFTPKSDVWSFAVTLWEILTFAREQPYEDFSDDRVLENIANFGQNNGDQEVLPQPINCPKEIYDLMRECWQRNETSRPNFREIHLFLQRKNLGYQPGD